MKLFRNVRFTAAFILVFALVLLLASIPQNVPSFTLPITNTKVDLAPVTQKFSNVDLTVIGIPYAKENSYQLGLDLQGGAQLVYQVDMKEIPEADRETAFESARDTIERRINTFGATEPKVQTQKTSSEYRIIVEIPGETNVSSATRLIGQTAQLSFWEQGTADDEISTDAAQLLPFGVAQVFNNQPKKTDLTGQNLKTSSVTTGQSGETVVQIQFDSKGTKSFAEITKRNVGKPVAIVLDNAVITAPVVNEQITAGSAIISGGFTPDTAKSLAIALNSGALPAPLKLIQQSTIGPTLGLESLTKSLIAGVIGLTAVVVFMIIIYKKEGAVASVALLIYTVITLFIFKLFGITVTLAGVAGFILSIGMAVDANILIFERMKEERRMGKSEEVALRIGFQRAWTSIRDSNVSSLITVFILYIFGTGIIKGFALSLGIGILVSMFTAITITRTLLKALKS